MDLPAFRRLGAGGGTQGTCVLQHRGHVPERLWTELERQPGEVTEGLVGQLTVGALSKQTSW